jgi:hypothetical protein
MSETVFAKGAATGDIYKTALYAKRRFGGFEVGVVNTGETNGLTYKVEAAGPASTLEIPDWDNPVVVATDANVAADALGLLDIPAASASHTHYRVAVRSQATGAPASFVIFTEDEKA